jgi:DNA replication protein DnaC
LFTWAHEGEHLPDLASGEFLSQQRNVVLVDGTGNGKTHISEAI